MTGLDDFFDMEQLKGIPRQDDLVWDKNQLQEDSMSVCACNFRDRKDGEEQKDWMRDCMCLQHWMHTDYYHTKAGLERNILTGELLDLITLMPDSQTREIVDYIMSLRTIRTRQHDIQVLAIQAPSGYEMTGIVVRVMKERKFGFIRGKDGVNYFFHKQDFNGHFNDLATDVDARQTIEVQFVISNSKRGPRAGEVTRLDGGINTDFDSLAHHQEDHEVS